jgi:mannose-6-phosphate isomerase-like protein (cupin superfamily)
MSLTAIELEQFVAQLAAAPERWRRAVRHANDVRVYEQIWDDDDVNAWVICWSHDQDTGFHDHDESSAAIAVIDGQVREDRLRLDQPPRSRTIGPGSVFTVPATAIHRVLHAGDAPAVTIHAYSPPLIRTGAYRIGPDGELERELLSGEEELRATPALS